MTEERKDVRFEEIGRVDAPDLCALPGVLSDISASGCRVHFPIPVDVDFEEEKEYELKIYPSRANTDEIELLCVPCWKSDDENTNSETELGFKIIHSPGMKQLESYIHLLDEEKSKNSEFEIENPEYSFI
ncbi:MAG: PilZ domain-containing protein [Spirochaetaceae bacterium]|nr:PilZ domain-containing protein [Spirochaetaceae bacterium]